MMARFILLGCLFLQMTATAQKKEPIAFAQYIDKVSLKKHLSVIASDSMNGRETGTEGQRKAAAYIEQQFTSIGLLPAPNQKGYQQFYPLKKDSVKSMHLMIDNHQAIMGKDFYIPIGVNESNTFTGKEIVFVGYGIDDEQYSDYQKKDVKGKVIVFVNGEPKKNNLFFLGDHQQPSKWSYPGLSKKLATAFQKGAIGALYINYNQPLINNNTLKNNLTAALSMLDNESETKTNCAILSHEYAIKILGDDMNVIIDAAKNNRLLNEVILEKKIPTLFTFEKQSDTIYASNVIGMIEGSEKKDEYVFLTSHYDHLGNHGGKIYNGADDDGSGTVAVIQMAAAFAKAAKEGNRPKRNIVFMTVSGEEKGLWGSEYYTDHPIFPLEKTSVDLNTDMIGRIDTERKKADTLNYVYVVGHNKLSSELPVINEKINNSTTQLVLDYKFDDPQDPNRIYYRSDHYNFARKGVPVLFFYDGMLQSDYHQPTDDVEKINWPLYEKRTRMIFLTAWEMANRNELLKRDKPLD